MKCLSIKQPWAALIVHGVNGVKKDVENRSWPTKHRGLILVHASKSVDQPAMDELKQKTDKLPPMPTGCIVGMVKIVDCKKAVKSVWHKKGLWGWYLADPVAVLPVPCPGQLGLYERDLSTLKDETDRWWDKE